MKKCHLVDLAFVQPDRHQLARRDVSSRSGVTYATNDQTNSTQICTNKHQTYIQGVFVLVRPKND